MPVAQVKAALHQLITASSGASGSISITVASIFARSSSALGCRTSDWSDLIPHPAYDPFWAHVSGLMEQFAQAESTKMSEIVAAMVEAAEDSTDRLHYVVGAEARNLATARRETSARRVS